MRTSFLQSQGVKLFTRYILPLVAVVLALETNWLVAPFLSVLPPFLTFLAAVMVSAWYGGFPSAVFATVLSIILIDFYFIPSIFSFSVRPADWAPLAFFAVEATTMAYCIDYLQNSRRHAVTREGQLQRLQHLSGRLVEETTLDSMLEEVLKASIELMVANKGIIQLHESRDQVLRLVKQIGFKDEFSSRFDGVPIGAFLCGSAFERKQRIVIENIETDPNFSHLARRYGECGVTGAQSTPLFTAHGMVFGVLSTYWSRPYRPSITDFQLLDLYAHQAERILIYKRNEELLHQANEELERSVTGKQVLIMERDNKLTKLMSELILTEERERRELSQELHDSLAQLLSLAKMKLSLAEGSLSKATDKVGQYIQESKQVLERSLRFTRTLMAEFNPPDFTQLGLSGSLVWLKDRMQQHDLLVSLHMDCESVVLPHHQVVLLYKCVRELLMNVVKHAKVKTANITMTMKGNQTLEITVQDQGIGFCPTEETPRIPGHHFGLRSVRERVEDLGGRFDIQSAIGKGCTVTLSLTTCEVRELEDSRAAENYKRDRVVAKLQSDPNQETFP
ncbi:MAG TPA: DUF4118 domain-containing protein [Nitrospira sp.]